MKAYSHEVIKDIIVLENFLASDTRGEFIKIYNKDFFEANNINFIPKEIFYSKSCKNVIRGMHFQLPPYEQAKLVHVISGCVEDVIVDLRKSSNTYGKSISIRLQAKDNLAIYIPSGFAHGFLATENNTAMMYIVDQVYSGESDAGIKWDTVGKKWNVDNPIISDRDSKFVALSDFRSPF